MMRSGVIWKQPPRLREHVVAAVCKKLKRNYGMPRLGNPSDPLDDLLYIVLSNKTAPHAANNAFARLRARFPDWGDILKGPIRDLRILLRPAGLSSVKSRQIRAALRAIERRFGRCDLKPLKHWQPEEMEEFLAALPGVSEKVAKCVMMYTLGAQVLPVDVHVHRIAKRLGWTSRKRADQCHQELESLVPPKWRHAFHVACVLHGRRICRPHEPQCSTCCVRPACDYAARNKND